MEKCREAECTRIATECYKHVSNVLCREDVDTGLGIAVCTLLSGWLEASAKAQLTLSNKALSEIPYYKTEGK